MGLTHHEQLEAAILRQNKNNQPKPVQYATGKPS